MSPTGPFRPKKDDRTQRRRAMRGAAALFLLAAVVACQPAGAGGGRGAATPTPSFSAPSRFQETLKALAPAYTFEATISVGGKVATHATGRWVNGAGEFVVEAQGGAITYRAVPPRAWVFDDDSGWTELDSGAPLGSPVDMLGRPRSLATVGGTHGDLDVRAVYPAAALGLNGDPVTVELTLGGDGSVKATYRLDTPGGAAVSETRMVPGSNLEPVVAPR